MDGLLSIANTSIFITNWWEYTLFAHVACFICLHFFLHPKINYVELFKDQLPDVFNQLYMKNHILLNCL
jgi:hypothetical protein